MTLELPGRDDPFQAVPRMELKKRAASHTCVTCSGTSCNGHLTSSFCPLGQDFCMSSILDGADGSRNQTRRCVTKEECFNKWIQKTLTSPECMSLLASGSGPSGQDLSCDFCCTSNGCNSAQFPPPETLYHDI